MPESCIAPYDKELENVAVRHDLGEVGGEDLVIDADFGYVYYEALSGRVPWVPTAHYSAGIWLRVGDRGLQDCSGPLAGDGPPTSCQLGFLRFDDEEAWRAGQSSFFVTDRCTGDSRAAFRVAIAGETMPSEGRFVVEHDDGTPRWTTSLEETCEDAMTIPWPSALVPK